jgi:hypothetical protein
MGVMSWGGCCIKLHCAATQNAYLPVHQRQLMDAFVTAASMAAFQFDCNNVYTIVISHSNVGCCKLPNKTME